MNTIACPAPAVHRVLIWKTDRFHADILRRVIEKIFLFSSVQIVRRVNEAEAIAAADPIDLLLTGIGSVEGDVLDFLSAHLLLSRRIRTAFVVTGQRDEHALAVLRTMPIAGVFDTASEDSEQFERAVRSVVAGDSYWSPSVLARVPKECLSPRALSRRLTATEQLVLATIGDGSDDQVAAERLQLKASTIKSVRRALHRKLGVQHRGELIRVAAQHGLVHFTPDAVVRPGSAIMLEAWRSQSRQRNTYTMTDGAGSTDRVEEPFFDCWV